MSILLAYSLPRGNMFVEPLPSDVRLVWLHYFGFQASCHNTQISLPLLLNQRERNPARLASSLSVGLQLRPPESPALAF
jgi:hypothetical protein